MIIKSRKISHKKLLPYFKKLSSPYTELNSFLEEAEELSLLLPLELSKAIVNFKHVGNTEGCLLIKNLLLDSEIPDTPNVAGIPKKTFYSEGYLAAISFLLGEPYGYKQESNGDLIHNLFPSQKNQFKQSSDSSKSNLEFHTEIVFHPFSPDFLILVCLRQDPDKKAQTLVSSIRKVLAENLLSQADIDTLRKPIYRTGIDYSFGNVNTTKANGPTMPCLYGDVYDQLLSFDLDLMVGLTPEGASALLKLKEALQAVSTGVKLEKGDLIIIDNRRVIHGRTPFPAYFDGQDRWLQRCLVSRNLQHAEILFEKKEKIISFTHFEYIKAINRSVYE